MRNPKSIPTFNFLAISGLSREAVLFSSVHLLLKTLLDKNIIEVAGLKKTTRNYARTFRATMSQYDYFFQEDFQNVDLKRKIQFMKIIIQNASLEELEEINNVISQISNRVNK